ncbi:MAG: hypothetical protein ACLFUT_09210 [Desulfobacteraceae bacterium]
MRPESDPKVVKRLAQAREDENWQFRSFLEGIGVVQNCSVCPIVFNVFERLKDALWHQWGDVWEDDENGEEWI